MVYFILTLALLVIRVAEFLLFARAIFSWIPVPQSLSGIYSAVYNLTEPLISPFRRLLSKWAFAQNSPIDISFLAAVLVLEMIRSLLIIIA